MAAFLKDTRSHKHIQRCSQAELNELDREVERIQAATEDGRVNRSEIIRRALALYFDIPAPHRNEHVARLQGRRNGAV